MSTPRQDRCPTCDHNTVCGDPFHDDPGVTLEPTREIGCPNLYDRARSELGKVMEKFGVEIPQGDNSIEYLANMLAAAVSKNLQQSVEQLCGDLRKDVAILDGGDWADASVTLLAVPANLDLQAAQEEYDAWRETHPYMGFPDWLKRYKSAGDSKVEIFWRD